MAENKTQVTDVDPAAFVAAVDDPARRADAEVLLELLGRVTGYPPRMWGPSIVGFGRYRYHYASGRQGDSLITGFSPRKANLVVYGLSGEDDLARLGKHKAGKSCLYIGRLADIDLAVLEQIVTERVAQVRGQHATWDS